MPLRINHNIAAINARRRLGANNRDLGIRLERLSSGLRVNRAADDAAGLSVREGMRAEISGLRQNVLNAEQGSNLLAVAEGSLNEISAMLIRMRELAVQSSSSTINDLNRESIQAEYTQIIQEIDRMSLSTTYNDQVLLTGYGNAVDATSTALTASNTSGVLDIKISGASPGTYTFTDTGGDSEISLGNGIVSQTISVGTLLDGSSVATGTTVVANFIMLAVIKPLAVAMQLALGGIPALLLQGPPGVAKSSIIKAKLNTITRAAKVQVRLLEVLADKIFSSNLGDSAKRMHAVFSHALSLAESGQRVLVVFDDIDAIGITRAKALNGSNPVDVVHVVTTLFAGIDRLSARTGIGIAATSNHLGQLDPALLDRFGIVIPVGFPDAVTRWKILLDATGSEHSGLPRDAHQHGVELIQATEGWSGRALRKRLVQTAMLLTGMQPRLLSCADLIRAIHFLDGDAK